MSLLEIMLFLTIRSYIDFAQLQVLIAKLKPTASEKETAFWKSLKDEPNTDRFALQYKSRGSRKKKPIDGGNAEMGDQAPTLSAAELDRVAEAAASKVFDKMKELLKENHDKLVDDVAEKVTSKLLERGLDYVKETGLHMDLDTTPIVQQPDEAEDSEGEAEDLGDKEPENVVDEQHAAAREEGPASGGADGAGTSKVVGNDEAEKADGQV